MFQLLVYIPGLPTHLWVEYHQQLCNFVSIPTILFNSFVNFAVSYSSLSEIILFDNPCNFHILFLNNLVNSFTNISFIVITKYDNLSHTTKIIYFSATNDKFIINLTVRYVYSFPNISFNISFPASVSV